MSNLNIKYHKLDTGYLTFTFPYHSFLKDHILQRIEKQEADNLTNTDAYYSDNIDRLDWKNGTKWDREWVVLLKPYLEYVLGNAVSKYGFSEIFPVEAIWFQQYNHTNTHGWHIHGDNFSCVYYLELPKTAPVTQLLDLGGQNVVLPDVVEGDILVFPSTVIHRAPILQNNDRKTIISCNFSVKTISQNLLDTYT